MTDSAQIIIATAAMLGSAWYFFFGPGHTSSGDQARPPGSSRRQVPEADIRQVCDTFPTISPTAARYDLEKTGSVEATCNKFLERGFLQEPPAGYYPAVNPPPPQPAARPTPSQPKPVIAFKAPTLIEKLNLHDRILEDVTNNVAVDKSQAQKWAASAEDREATLRRRKENMVLESRRKLIEKDRKGKAVARE